MSFKQHQPKSKTWQSQSKSQFQQFLILISLFCFLWSAESKTINPSFISQQMIREDWSPILEAQETPQSTSTFFDEKKTNSFNALAPSSSLPTQMKLSMGRSLSTLNMNVYSVVLTRDGQTAFASIVESGEIKILDVSNSNKISIIGSIRVKMERPFLRNSLALSPDEKTLFMSTMLYLHVIDVSNIRAPRILGELKDQHLASYLQELFVGEEYPVDYHISIAVSKDQKTLFIAGIGYQVIDISNKNQPMFIDSNTDQVDDEKLKLSEVKMSPDGERLFLANGTLNIFNISNPRKWQFLGSYSLQSYLISSVFPSKQYDETVYIAGYMEDDLYSSKLRRTIYQKINIRDPSKPVTLESYDLKYHSGGVLHILGLSFNETIAYILAYPKKSEVEVGVLNFCAGQSNFKVDQDSISSITSIAIFPDDSKILVARFFGKFLEIRELYQNYPNNRIYSSADIDIEKLSFEDLYLANSMVLSSDSNTLIVKGRNKSFTTTELKIINVTIPENPKVLSSWNCLNPILSTTEIKFLEDVKQIAVISEWTESISFLNLSEDLKNIELTRNFSTKDLGKVASFQISSDGKIGYFIFTVKNDSFLRTISFPDFKILNETKVNIYKHKSFLTKDNRFLLLIGSKILILDVSNLHTPQEISSTLIDFHEQNYYPTHAVLSPDEKMVYTRTFDGFTYSLRIYDIQKFSAVQLLSDLPLPRARDIGGGVRDLLFTPDYKMAYMGFYKGYLIAINMSDPSLPFVQGTFIVPGEEDLGVANIWKDGKTIFYSSTNTLNVAELIPPYTLYIDTESIRLGEKYHKSVTVLEYHRSGSRPRYGEEYVIFDDNKYKFINPQMCQITTGMMISKFTVKASLFEAKVDQNVAWIESTYSKLPYWMNFDKENQILTFEPNKQEHLGTYTFYSAFSMQFPRIGFRSIQLARNKSEDDDDLLMMMISCGYIDQRLFLTPNFGTFKDFENATPKNLSNKVEIYNTMKKYYFETFTMFDVFPSLDVSDSEFLSVNTLSENSIRVEIILAGENKFIKKLYGSIKPIITDSGSRLIIEGLQKDVNNALELLVVNLQNTTGPCEGTVTISDRLNPVFTKSFSNISKLFKINQQPKMKIPIQRQIDSSHVETGTYFTINFHKETFVDTWNNELSFELLNGNPGKSLPDWISFSNMSLRGTPPEEIAWQGLEFNLIVRNEFKDAKIPFTLKVRISPTFALKLLMRYSPYILSIVGLIVYANRIYNVVFKKRYRYPKDFSLKVGEEITSHVIPPMIFIWKEKQESGIILKHLKAKVTRELGKDSIHNLDLAEYFATSEGSRIDKLKLENNIKEILKDITHRKKLDSYFNGAEESKALTNQLIFNKLTYWLLEKNEETKRFFDMIKGDWMDLVEWDLNSGMCKIKESQFLELVAQADLQLEGKNDNYSLMTDSVKEVINVNLLKDAIESYALKKQSIDHHSKTAHIMIKFKMEKIWIKRFLKKDLEDVHDKMTCGIYFKVENDVLSFHGVPEKRFINQTVVIQVTTKRQKILNEIWIHGVSNNQHSESFVVDEEIDKGYEVY